MLLIFKQMILVLQIINITQTLKRLALLYNNISFFTFFVTLS
jgi:hypothetical protein